MRFRSLLALLFPAYSNPSSPEALLREGRFAEAEQGLRAKPADTDTQLALGYLALLRNDLAEAERRLQAVLAAKPKKAAALLAEAYYRRDDFERAAALFEKAGQAPKARKLASFAGQKPYAFDRAASTVVPFLATDPIPVLDLTVDGRTGRFILDTGGGELILDSAFAKAVGAKRFGAEKSYFGGGKSAAVEHGRVESVDLGGLAVHGVPVNILDLSAIGPALGAERIDGVVGTVLLYHFRSTIDYAGGRLVLEPRLTPPVDDGATAIPFYMADDHFVVASGTVEKSAPMLFFVDTGLAGAAFTCPKSTLERASITLPKAGKQAGLGGGGTFAMTPFTVGELSLGPVRRSGLDAVAGAFPKQLEWDLEFRIGGLISHQFFRSGSLTLDFERMHLILR